MAHVSPELRFWRVSTQPMKCCLREQLALRLPPRKMPRSWWQTQEAKSIPTRARSTDPCLLPQLEVGSLMDPLSKGRNGGMIALGIAASLVRHDPRQSSILGLSLCPPMSIPMMTPVRPRPLRQPHRLLAPRPSLLGYSALATSSFVLVQWSRFPLSTLPPLVSAPSARLPLFAEVWRLRQGEEAFVEGLE